MSQDPRGFDKASALLALAASLAVSWYVWSRLDAEPAPPDPPALGTPAPALRLLDPETAEPLVLRGMGGKVVWVTFLSAVPPTGASDLADLEAVWSRLKVRPKYAMAALAVDAGRPDLLRAAVASARSTLPAYLAAPETRRAFGADARHLPLHVLIHPDGLVGVVARGHGADTLARLADQARRWLDELDPPARGRLSVSRGAPGGGPS